MYSNLKDALTFGFTGGWLVNGARASPANFSPTCTGSQRPVISFHDQPIIHVTFGLVEFSNLITPSAGSSGRKSISLTAVDTEFDWLGHTTAQSLEPRTCNSIQQVTISMLPSQHTPRRRSVSVSFHSNVLHAYDYIL